MPHESLSLGVVDPKEADEVLTGDYPQGFNYKKLFLKGSSIIGGMHLTEELEDVWPIIDAIKSKADVSEFKADLLKPGFLIKEALEKTVD